MIFSKRTNWELSSNQLMIALKRLHEENVTVFDLTESNPTHCGFSYPNEILPVLANTNNLNYEPATQGLLRAREVISDYYKSKNVDVSSENIFLTASTSEAYTYLFRLLTNPQDHVLFPKPSYPLFQFLCDLNDITMDYYSLVYDGKEWKIDFDSLERNMSQQTKAIVLVNPNNPTGSFVSQEELVKLNKFCLKHPCAIISDEVFADYGFTASSDDISLVNNRDVLTFVLGGVSKTLLLPQMKLAWMIISGPQDFFSQAKARLEIIADTYLSINAPTQNALQPWFNLRETIQQQIKARLIDNLHFIHEEIKTSPHCSLFEVQAGWYVILKVPTVLSEEEWVLIFLQQDHVLVHPGYFFDFEEEGYLVLSLLPEEKVFKEGIKRILKRICNFL